MYRSRAKAGYYAVDDKRVWLESAEEYKFITRLVGTGFSGKWLRPQGVRFGTHNYTADFAIDIMWNGVPRKAFVEYKPTSANQFSRKARTRAVAALHYHGANPLLLLYINKTRTWWQVDVKTKQLIRCSAPEPAAMSIPLPRRVSVPFVNPYGRAYSSRIWVVLAEGVANILEELVQHIMGDTKRRKPRKRHTN